MQTCSPNEALIIKSDKYSLSQSPETKIKEDPIKDIVYTFDVGKLLYAQVCTRSSSAYAINYYLFRLIICLH